MTASHELRFVFALGVVVTLLTAAGIGVRATHGAQTTADEPQYLLSALSLWGDGDLDIGDELAEERYRTFHEADLPEQTVPLGDGRRVSPHDPLLPLLLAGPVGLGGWIGAKIAMALTAGALAGLTVWVARQRLGISAAVAYPVAGLFALSPPLAVYATQIYPEIPAALVLLVGVAALLGPFTGRGRTVWLVAVVALPWLAVKYVPVAAMLAGAGLVKAGRGGRRTPMLVLALAAVTYLVGHLALYGGLTAYAAGDHFVAGEFTAVGSQVNLWGRSSRLLGLLVDRGFGIGVWAPGFLLLPVAGGWLLAGRRRELAPAGWLLATGWLVAVFVALTMHGWWFPGRQLVVVLPLAVLLIAAWADESARSRLRMMLPLGLIGLVAFAFLVLEGLGGDLTWVVDFGATSNPAYHLLAVSMPDYMAPDVRTWVLHGIWVGIVVLMGWSGWRPRPAGEVGAKRFNEKATKERVST